MVKNAEKPWASTVYSFGQNVQKCPKSHPVVLTRKLSTLNFLHIILGKTAFLVKILSNTTVCVTIYIGKITMQSRGEKALEARKELLALAREEHNKLSRL